MAALLVLLLAAPAPVFETFDEPPDPARWYVGVPAPPEGGALTLPKECWIASRGIPDEGLESVEVVFVSRGGALEVGFHEAREPLTSPVGDPLVTPRGGGEHLLVVRARGATLDGEPLGWSGELRGTFRLAARSGAIGLLEVRVVPAPPSPEEPPGLEGSTVFGPTTPRRHREGNRLFQRVTLPLWDVEVAFLAARGPDAACEPLAGPARGCPTLGCLLTVTNGRALARAAAQHPLAAKDWADERRNLGATAFESYLASEYAQFEAIELVQRVLNAHVPERPELEALVALAVIRHSENPHAALALAETRKARAALQALRKAAGGEDPGRLSPDALRARAGEAAGLVLDGPPPAAWAGFSTSPGQRFVTMQRIAELTR